MKLLISIIVIFFCVRVQAQLNYSRNVQLSSSSPVYTNMEHIRLVPLQKRFLLSSYGSISGYPDIVSVITNSGYNLIEKWSRVINRNAPGNTYALSYTGQTGTLSNGNYFFFGYVSDSFPSTAPGDTTGFVMRDIGNFITVFDSTGNLVWCKGYLDTLFTQNPTYIPVFETSNNALSVFIPLSNYVYWFKVDNNGNLIDNDTYNIPWCSSGGVSNMGSSTILSSSPALNYSYTIKKNAFGAIDWCKKHGPWNIGIFDTHVLSDKSILHAGYYNGSSALIKTDSLGNFLWGKSYTNSSFWLNYPVRHVHSDDNGNIFLFSDTLMIKTDSNGNLLAARDFATMMFPSYDQTVTDTFAAAYFTYPNGFTIMLFDTAFTNNCFYPVTGFTVADIAPPGVTTHVLTDMSNMYAVNIPIALDYIDIQFVTAPVCTTPWGIEGSSIAIKIDLFPNPATNQITISHQFEVPLNATLINTMGEKIAEMELLNPMNTVYLNAIASGIYNVVITDAKGSFIAVKKLIIID